MRNVLGLKKKKKRICFYSKLTLKRHLTRSIRDLWTQSCRKWALDINGDHGFGDVSLSVGLQFYSMAV